MPVKLFCGVVAVAVGVVLLILALQAGGSIELDHATTASSPPFVLTAGGVIALLAGWGLANQSRRL